MRALMSGRGERELIDLGKRGEVEAIDELFERHYRGSLQVARGILRCPAEAEDAVQAAYCSAFQHLQSFRQEASFSHWITRIVVNYCLMVMRDPWRRRRVHGPADGGDGHLDGYASPTGSPEQEAWCGQLGEALDRAVLRLPQSLREAYSLYALAEMPVAEVASALRVSQTAAKSRIFRARGAVRMSLGKRIAGIEPTSMAV